MKPCAFIYHRPSGLPEALALLAAHAPTGGRVLAGGQSLVPMMAYRMAQPSHLIDINHIATLQGAAMQNGALVIGTTTRHAAFKTGICPGPLGAMLGFVSSHIAHGPIRNRGTFGGSLANADPASEWCLVMVTLGGRVMLQHASGTRMVAAGDFFTGVMATALADDEMLTEAHLPWGQGDQWGFYEISRRAGDYALAMCLVVYRLDNGLMRDVRLGIGGAEATPRRLAAAEAILAGQAPTGPNFIQAADAAAAMLKPMTDHNVTALFRRDLVRAAVRRALHHSLNHE
ncbi:MAG: FAD binding domain-containing protein [Acidocella sp.]|nr:FAD binding domain-containing protein [Acidocella sp.]